MKYLLCVFVGLILTSCNASVETLCEDIAVMQCEKCTSCGEGSAQAASFCGVSCGDDGCDDCVEVLSNRCNSKSGVLPEPKVDIEICETDLAGLECSTLILSETQGHDNTVSSCVGFFN